LGNQLDIQPGSEVKLPDVDADVFNLVMNWTYTDVHLPRVEGLAEYYNPETPQPHHLVPCPVADQFIPYREPVDQQSNTIDSYCNITFQKQYQDFSIEELRLHFMRKARISSKEQDDATGQASDPSEDASNELECKKDVILIHQAIPSPILEDDATKAENLQITLLKLMIFAENYKWEPLFNDAIDAFRSGEATLQRTHALTSHIFLAFSSCQAPSQVQTFIGDYAISLGYRNGCMSNYQDLLSCQPAFFSFMLARMDTEIPDGYTEMEDKFDINNHDGPKPNLMDRAHITYHIHHGAFVMFCPCRTGSHFARRGIYVGLPIWDTAGESEEEAPLSS
jgi:hypothetical protein